MNGNIPFLLIPRTVLDVVAWNHMSGLSHDPVRHALVCPDTPIGQLPRDFELIGSVEDFGSNPDHTTGEADEVLT